MLEITKLISALSNAFSNPYLYLIGLCLAIIYVMYKSNNDDKKDIIDKFSHQLENTTKHLDEAQKTNASFARTIEVQMGEHRHAIKEIAITIREMRKDVDDMKQLVQI
jgi:septal ring factor EnvC (AmiA/AmiB activator)